MKCLCRMSDRISLMSCSTSGNIQKLWWRNCYGWAMQVKCTPHLFMVLECMIVVISPPRALTLPHNLYESHSTALLANQCSVRLHGSAKIERQRVLDSAYLTQQATSASVCLHVSLLHCCFETIILRISVRTQDSIIPAQYMCHHHNQEANCNMTTMKVRGPAIYRECV